MRGRTPLRRGQPLPLLQEFRRGKVAPGGHVLAGSFGDLLIHLPALELGGCNLRRHPGCVHVPVPLLQQLRKKRRLRFYPFLFFLCTGSILRVFMEIHPPARRVLPQLRLHPGPGVQHPCLSGTQQRLQYPLPHVRRPSDHLRRHGQVRQCRQALHLTPRLFHAVYQYQLLLSPGHGHI